MLAAPNVPLRRCAEAPGVPSVSDFSLHMFAEAVTLKVEETRKIAAFPHPNGRQIGQSSAGIGFVARGVGR
jgi:hypothetical protein